MAHHPKSLSSPQQQQQQQRQNQVSLFQTLKFNCLSKRDKSSAGRIDPRAVDICAVINARHEYYTTSSCSGRCFLYCGDGIKSWHTHTTSDTPRTTSGGRSSSSSSDDTSDVVAVREVGEFGNRNSTDDAATGYINNNNNSNSNIFPNKPTPSSTINNKLGFFQRYRVNHDFIHEPLRYFDLTTLFNGSDPTGGGDPIPTIGQFDHGNNASFKSKLDDNKNAKNANDSNSYNKSSSSSSSSLSEAAAAATTTTSTGSGGSTTQPSSPIWLRFEPFILHVMCHSLKSASVLMAAARPAFKNVGLTSWHCDDGIHGEVGGGTIDYGDDEDNNRNNYYIMDDNVHTSSTSHSHHHPQEKQQCKKGKCPRYLVAIWGDEGLDMVITKCICFPMNFFYLGRI